MAQASKIAHRLLALDDDADCAELIVRTALKCGFEAFPLTDPRALHDSIGYWRPHLLTLDLCLPNLDGIELFSLLSALQFQGQIVIVSGQPDWFREQATTLASRQGLKVSTHLGKPIHLPELRSLFTIIRVGLLAREAQPLPDEAVARTPLPNFSQPAAK
jgi:DNA-binding response OmpR family regulator